MLRRILLVDSVLLLHSPLEGQVRGVVRDESGSPVEGARIEIWRDTPTPIGMLSNQEGAFRVSEEQLRNAERLSVRRIGFRPVIIVLLPSDSLVEVMLEAEPIVLAGVTVAPLPDRVTCPRTDQLAARQAWQTSRERYAEPPAGSAYRAMALSRSEIVSRPTLEQQTEDRLRPSWQFWVGGGSALPLDPGSTERLYATALAWQQSGYRSPREEFFAWDYAQLFTYGAHHFASRRFGVQHIFGLFRESEDELVLIFCPASPSPGSIEGYLRVAADGSLQSARWAYRTSAPDERAGGEVVFRASERSDTLRPRLEAESAMFWRRMHGSDRYTQHWYRFLAWEVGPDVIRLRGQATSR